jgi:hypothetical protein
MEITTSALATASAAWPATTAPKAPKAVAFAAVRFQTAVENPAWQRFRAIGAPISPVPNTAILCWFDMPLTLYSNTGQQPFAHLCGWPWQIATA